MNDSDFGMAKDPAPAIADPIAAAKQRMIAECYAKTEACLAGITTLTPRKAVYGCFEYFGSCREAAGKAYSRAHRATRSDMNR